MKDFWIDGFTTLSSGPCAVRTCSHTLGSRRSVAPAVASMANQAASHEAAFEAKLVGWLKQRKKP